MLELVAERPKRPGVVYAGSRDGVDELSRKLIAAGVPAMAYHAGVDKEVARPGLSSSWRPRRP